MLLTVVATNDIVIVALIQSTNVKLFLHEW